MRCSYILCSLPIILTEANKWLSGWRKRANCLGTWVRIPGPPKRLFHFSLHNHMQVSKSSPPCISNIKAPCGFRRRSSGYEWESTILPSQWACRESWKVKIGLSQWAWKLQKHLQNLAQHPLQVYSFSFLFLFLLF